jgi:hypothetical protein
MFHHRAHHPHQNLLRAIVQIQCVRLLSRLMEMIHMILYEEEVSGALWPEKVNTRGPRAVTWYHVHVAELKETAPINTIQPLPPTVSTSNEARITIAIKATKSDAPFSQQAAARAYLVPQATLSYRNSGRALRRDCLPNCQNLTLLEEKTIVERILNLDLRGFPLLKGLL